MQATTLLAPAVTLSAVSLTKRFGSRVALRPTSFEVHQGEIVGVIGPNGAGKTTLLSILADVLEPDDGQVKHPDKRPLGWVPQQPAVYSKLSVIENLTLFARLEKLEDPEQSARQMLAEIGLQDRAEDEVGNLSGGNQQRVNIGIGLLSQPSTLLLDEPSASLDPRQRERLWEFIGKRAAGGTAIVFSTHNIGEVERYASRVLVLVDGELLFGGTPAELNRTVGESRDLEGAFVRFLHDHGH